MTLTVRVGGAWKVVPDTNVFKVRVGGAWKDVVFMRVYRNHEGQSAWRDIWVRAAATPTPPPAPTPTPPVVPPVVLSVNVVPTEISGTKVGTGVVTTNAAVAQVSNGTGPYTYQWVLMAWSSPLYTPVLVTPQVSSTTLSQQMDDVDDYQNAVIKCIVTDSLGNTGQGQSVASFYTTSRVGSGGSGGGGGGWDPEP